MKNKYYIIFLVAICFGLAPIVSAQDSTPIPTADSNKVVDPPSAVAEQDEESSGAKSQDDGSRTEQQDAEEKKRDEKKPAPKKKRRRSSIWPRSSLRAGESSKQSKEFVAVFEPVVASANGAVLQIMSGKRQIALGTIVDSNGLVLTKASELPAEITCKLNDGEVVKATIIGVHPDSDLALLKIEAKNLTVAQWSDAPPPVIGKWIASPKTNKEDPMIGVVSVNARIIPPSSPYMGIDMREMEKESGVRINFVQNNSPAFASGLQINDVILKIDSSEVKDMKALREILGNYDVNDRITILIRRFGKQKTLHLTLGARDKVSLASQRSNMQNDMGSKLSRRRKDFPNAFQHDSMLNSNTCGGPIVDLSGKVVGVNIARAGRVASLALPVSTVLPILEDLKTGEWAPEIVNKEKIDSIGTELEEIAVVLGRLPDKKSVLERKYNVEKARVEELEKTVKSLQDRLKVIGKKSASFKTELDSVSKDIRIAQRNRKRLLGELERLKGGGH